MSKYKKSFGKRTNWSGIKALIGLTTHALGFGGNSVSGLDPKRGVRRFVYANHTIGTASRFTKEQSDRVAIRKMNAADDRRDRRNAHRGRTWSGVRHDTPRLGSRPL